MRHLQVRDLSSATRVALTIGMLTLLTAPIAAQQPRTIADVDRDLATLRERVDGVARRTGDVRLDELDAQLKALAADVTTLKLMAAEVDRPREPLPRSAWVSLTFVGAFFAAAWAWVSHRREQTRRFESEMQVEIERAKASR